MARRVFAAGSVNLGPIVYQNDAKLVKDMAERFTATGIKPQVDGRWLGMGILDRSRLS